MRESVRLVRESAFFGCASRSVAVRESLVREFLVRESDGAVCESAVGSANPVLLPVREFSFLVRESDLVCPYNYNS